MILSNLNKMKKYYPTFLDKSDNSNFTKHLKVINTQQLDLYQSLKKLDLGKILNRPITIKKEQKVPYYQTLTFEVILNHLKTVTIYKDHTIIYQETYDNENVNNFKYQLECEKSESIIPTEAYVIDVTTYDEFHFQKGYPENDEKFNDIYDHDYNLDTIGNLLNIKRHNFRHVEPYQYYNTLPRYHAKTTEDDYYYMERIKYYITHYNVDYLPVLEMWKYYNMNTELINRYHIISVQDESYMTPNNAPKGVTFLPNQVVDNYTNLTVSNSFILPYFLNVAGGSKYYFSIDINNSIEPIIVKIYYFDNEGNSIHVDNVEITTDSTVTYYCYIDTPSSASKIQIKINSNNDFTFSNLNLQKVEKILIGDEAAKYMRTKTDYNSCVYDMYGVYSDVPINLRLPVGDEIENLLCRCMPITKKCHMNLLYQPEEETQHLTIYEKNNIILKRNIENIKSSIILNLSKTYISKRLNSDNLYGFENSFYDVDNDCVKFSADGFCLTPRINLDNIIKIETDAKNLEVEYYHVINTHEGIDEYEILTFREPIFNLPGFNAINDFIKFKSLNDSGEISYIHFYSNLDHLEETDIGDTIYLNGIINTSNENILTIYDDETADVLTRPITINDAISNGNIRIETPNIYFDNIISFFADNPITINTNETYTIGFDVIENPDYLSIQVIQLDENDEIIETSESDFLECPSWKTEFYFTFNTHTRCEKIYFKIIPKTIDVYTQIRNLNIKYNKVTNISDEYKNFKAIKIDTNSEDTFQVQTGNGNIYTNIRHNERAPLIINLNESKQFLKIITNAGSFEIYGVK